MKRERTERVRGRRCSRKQKKNKNHEMQFRLHRSTKVHNVINPWFEPNFFFWIVRLQGTPCDFDKFLLGLGITLLIYKLTNFKPNFISPVVLNAWAYCYTTFIHSHSHQCSVYFSHLQFFFCFFSPLVNTKSTR